MEPDESTNQEYWKVLQRIKRNGFFKPSPGPVEFGPASDIEKGVLLDLQDEGAIKVLNLSRFPTHIFSSRPSGISMSEEIKLEIIQPAFNEVYEEVKKEVEIKDLSQVDEYKDGREPSDVRRDNRELRKEINSIIKNKGLINQEKDFLQFLAKTFKPEQIADIGSEISSKDCKHVKQRVSQKLEGTNFRIATIKAKRFYKGNCYQLEYHPSLVN